MTKSPIKTAMSYPIAFIVGSGLGFVGPWVYFLLAWGGTRSTMIGVLGLSLISFVLAYQHGSSDMGSDILPMILYWLPITFFFGRYALRFYRGSEGMAGAIAWLIPPFASACAIMVGYLIGRRSTGFREARSET